MYVQISKGGKDGKLQYVRIVRSDYVNGRSKTVVLENLGRLDRLLEQDPDILEKLKARCEAENEDKHKARDEAVQDKLSEMLQADNSTDTESSIMPPLNYGPYILRPIWEKDLTLPSKIKNLQRKHTDCKEDLNQLVSHLCFSKLIHPTSILRTHTNKDLFLGNPLQDVSLGALYRTLDFLDDQKEELFAHINNRMNQSFGKDRYQLIYYDVTNTYFESTMTDKERGWEADDFEEQLCAYARQMCDEGRLSEDCFDEEGSLIAEALPDWVWRDISSEQNQDLRMRGLSKEHRFDLPLVSIALVIDKLGFAVDFEVFAGNKSEFGTMESAIERLKKRYQIGHVTVVADRDLNSAGNLSMLLDAGMGFLFSQNITQLTGDLKKQAFDLTRYQPIDPKRPSLGAYQVIDHYVRKGTTGPDIACKLVLTFNEKRQARDLALLDNWVAMVNMKAAQGVKVEPRRTGWAQLAKLDGDSKASIVGIDKTVLKKKQAMCGFAGVIYHEPIGISDDQKLKNTEIAARYHTLNQIENCFRILKSNIPLRCMHVYTAKHIRGYITACMLSLLVVQLLQHRLKAAGNHLSIHEICETLQTATVSPLKMGHEIVYCHTSGINHYRKDRPHATDQELMNDIKAGKIKLTLVNDLLEAVGLNKLNKFMKRTQLSTALRTRFVSDEAIIPRVLLECAI